MIPAWLRRFISRVIQHLASLFRHPGDGGPPPSGNPIDHVVVLMLENRSFTHMFEFLPTGDGAPGEPSNPIDPADPDSERVPVSPTASAVTELDPWHDIGAVNTQLFGTGQVQDPAPMHGFIKSYTEAAGGNVEIGKTIMQCFDPDRIPALSHLAREFCLCDRWFAAVPGPTFPNRYFVHAATSAGEAESGLIHLDGNTIYENLAAAGRSWNVYFGDLPQSLAILNLAHYPERFKPFELFRRDVESASLPHYSFIEPRYYDFFDWKANDQHPPHDVRLGEYLLAEVYETLRHSTLWERSLLVVVYDEHGGFFDDKPPPGQVPNPDGNISTDPPFDFTRLGVRVPAVLVSPLIEKGTVDHTVYEHASIPATLKTLFNLPGFLTQRDAAAHTFERNLTLQTPRTDTPTALPVPGDPGEAERQRRLLRSGVRVGDADAGMTRATTSQRPPSDYQRALLDVARHLDEQHPASVRMSAPEIDTEHGAATYVRACMSRFQNP